MRPEMRNVEDMGIVKRATAITQIPASPVDIIGSGAQDHGHMFQHVVGSCPRIRMAGRGRMGWLTW